MKTCKIIIKDEVNCKLEGLELPERRALSKKFEYEIPGARYLPSVKLGRWNGKVSYFQLGGSTYINLLPEIIPFLEELGYDLELEDLRSYATTFQFTEVSETTFADKTWPKGHPKEGQPVILRDYQVEIINTFLSNPQSISSVATGAGKTLVTAALSWSCQNAGRTVVIVPNKSLVVQTEEDYRNLGLDVGVYFGDRKEWGRTHTICTWQSLNALLKNTKNGIGNTTIGEFLEGVVCIMVDECHAAKSDVLKTLLTGIMSHIPIRWGLTGTIPKDLFASQALHVSIGPVVGKLTASELQDKGVLANCHVNIIQLQDYADFRDYQSELKHLLENSKRLDYIAKLISEVRKTGNTLVLVDRIAPGKELIDRLPDSVFVSGDTKLNVRKEEYDEVATSSNKVIVATYQVAAVGINMPRIFNLVIIEAGRSFVRTIQSIGRGLRKSHDKEHVEIWDITSTAKFSKRHMLKRKEFYKEAQYPFTIEKVEYL